MLRFWKRGGWWLAGACALLGTAIYASSVTAPRGTPVRLAPLAITAPQTDPTEAPELTGHYGHLRQGALDDRSQVPPATAERLAALGYAPGYEPANGDTGARVLAPDRIQPGLTLICSGHAPIVQLIDLHGEVVHTWRAPFDRVFPGGVPFVTRKRQRGYIRRAHVFPNGELLGVFEYIGIFKLDADSRVLWARAMRNHHDLSVAPDGSILSLVARIRDPATVRSQYPGVNTPQGGIIDDQVVRLDANGHELQRVSLLNALYHSQYRHLVQRELPSGEAFHTNSVTLVGEDADSFLTPGSVLLSIREMDALVALDMGKAEVTWAMRGGWEAQHQAQLLPSGEILFLDNLGGAEDPDIDRGRSRVLQLDPERERITWRYRGTAERPFFTSFLGYVERLQNGNTLVTESTQGRVFEVTREGDIVWEYRSPHRAGSHNELIATVMGAQRLDPEALPFLND